MFGLFRWIRRDASQNTGCAMTESNKEASAAASPALVFPPIAYTPEGAAQMSGRNRTRIFNAIKNRELTARKDGKATLIERDELVRWIGNMPIIQPATAAA
jgi:hypothetical protein